MAHRTLDGDLGSYLNVTSQRSYKEAPVISSPTGIMAVEDIMTKGINIPARGDLRAFYKSHPLPCIPSEIVEAASHQNAIKIAHNAVHELKAAVSSGSRNTLEALFFPDSEVYWKDQIALTWHYRGFRGARTISTNFLKLSAEANLADSIQLAGEPILMTISPILCLVDTRFEFSTASPNALANGRLLLLPVSTSGEITWKIWILSTWIEGLREHSEKIELLKEPCRRLDDKDSLETEVFIIGGGNAAAVLSARLKTLGVNSIMAERNPKVGDNWRLRYDGLTFHVPTSLCTMPYIEYPKELHTPHILNNIDLADHLERYVDELNLSLINSAEIINTEYNKTGKQWNIRFTTPQHGERTLKAKHLVLATGSGSQKPYIPTIPGRELYTGLSMHSNDFKNGQILKKQGVKSVLVVGSANTAFDVINNLHAASIPKITMNVRSSTYLCPVEYTFHPQGLGLYDMVSTEVADASMLTLPSIVEGQFTKGLMSMLASQEPDRYKALKEAGFPVLDATDPETCLMHNLLERAGGHYTETGAHKLIADRKVGVKALVEPMAFTEKGIRFSDGSEMEVDAVVWCTGFRDTNIGDVALEILGGDQGIRVGVEKDRDESLGPAEIAARIEPTWGIDTEGEIRGLWKRHAGLENFWIMAGYTQQHRWHSKNLAIQIKASLEGILPEAYRQTLS